MPRRSRGGLLERIREEGSGEDGDGDESGEGGDGGLSGEERKPEEEGREEVKRDGVATNEEWTKAAASTSAKMVQL